VQDRPSPLLISILCIGIAILYLPILVLIGYSFNASALVSVWGGFSTSWYRSSAQRSDPRCRLAVARDRRRRVDRSRDLGTLAAIALVRFSRFRGRLLLTGMVNAPLVMPEIITGITQLLLFISMLHVIGWPHRGFTTIAIAHIAFCTAYVTITVQSRLRAPTARSRRPRWTWGQAPCAPSSTRPCPSSCPRSLRAGS
jgi:putrescine transport system permease protein